MKKLVHDKLMTALLVLATMVTVIMVLIAQRYEIILKASMSDQTAEEYAQSYWITIMYMEENDGDTDGADDIVTKQYDAPELPAVKGNIIYERYTGSTFADSFDTAIAEVYLKYSEPPLEALESGRYPTAEEFERGDKLVVIGEGLLPFTTQHDDRLYMEFEQEAYEVIGILQDATGSGDDERMYMFFPSMGEKMQQYILEDMHTGIARLIYRSNTEAEDTETLLDAWIGEEFPETKWEIAASAADEEETILGDVSAMLYELSRQMVMLVYAFGVVSCFSVARIWAKRRTKEMMIRMAFGEAKGRIGIGFCLNLLCIQAAGTVMAFAAMFIAGISGSAGFLFANMNYRSIGIQTLLIFLITAIVPLTSIRQLSPAQGLWKWQVQG
ncbi:MAG: ABC transporter permease [Lachnospiraceae bacterium]|nr:ABC transporter permease [Lachnospiraceae bacterium]